MTQHRYNSFDEIDQRLKILSLQKEIDKENIKLNMHRSKNNLCPTNLLGGFDGFIQTVVLTFVTNKLFKKFSNRFGKQK
ncbi:MAG: DUF6327 family protein [Flavobacteriaceae bacterium]|nr:DUF6327 family protein [Flavobacteriaceae bacterium]